MTSAEIRQSFLDFFARHQHTIVPSASLLPDSPGLLFTNAGMNPFVPFFLGDKQPNVTTWAGAKAALDTRATDTQKCIRAGGKHNDLEDVGFDTYHHTLFEMLGNWSFGDYFKKESINWGWELLTKVWGIPAKRLFATVYSPDKSRGDPAEFDREAYDIWADIFRGEGLDPAVHIVHGNKKDNFWMMGDTGPCGPCSEIHFNLLPDDDETAGRALVNGSSPRCIEIWNHVFIQFNANVDGTFSPLAAKHVDTGMGFERVAGIYATSKGFTDFSKEPSNYAADIFTPLFDKIAALSGKTYQGTVPTKREGLGEQENIDIAFRVLADHARCVSCAIADGILPSNEGRNYVIRRILRRGILYGVKLGLKTGFFEQLVTPVVESLGGIFPELKQQQDIIRRVIHSEEENFGRTLEHGLARFEGHLNELRKEPPPDAQPKTFPGAAAFELYDTYGFPLDMTELLASEHGLTVDTADFERLMEAQRERGRASTKKEVVVAATEGEDAHFQPTRFVGYDTLSTETVLTDVVEGDKAVFFVFAETPFYAEMGGQLGDTGEAKIGAHLFRITDTIKDKSGRHLHRIADDADLKSHIRNFKSATATAATLHVDATRRRAINRHHTATHLLHWALRKVLGTHVRQAGSLNAPNHLRFDFAHFEACSHAQLQEVEALVNGRILENAPVRSYEVEFDKKPEGTLAFFGEKYGRIVRVVDTGGYSRELCGGTHVASTGEIGLIKIVSEGAIAAGTRRLEAVAGEAAHEFVLAGEAKLAAAAAKLGVSLAQFEQRLDAVLAQKAETEKKLHAHEHRALAQLAAQLAGKAVQKNGIACVAALVEAESPAQLRDIGPQVIAQLGGEGFVVLGAAFGADKASLAAFASPAAIEAGHQAGKTISALTAQLGGKGGGKPDFAMGGGKETAKLASVLDSLLHA